MSKKNRLHLATLLLCVLLLQACSQQPRIAKTLQQSTSAMPNKWQITAKLGIRSEIDNGSATLYWQQQQDQYYIRVSGPLGQGRSNIRGNASQITIERANKPTIYSDNPEQLLLTTFGWTLPLQHLTFWVRGLASPYLQTTEQQYQDQDTKLLHKLSQSGWALHYADYQRVDTWLMPGKISAHKDDISLTLIIKNWQFN